MNYSIIVYILGWIMNVEAVCMLVPSITALIYREKAGIAFVITILACLAIGGSTGQPQTVQESVLRP